MSGFLGDYRGARGGQVPGAVRARPSSQMRSAAHSITQTSFAAPLHTDLRQDSARCEPSFWAWSRCEMAKDRLQPSRGAQRRSRPSAWSAGCRRLNRRPRRAWIWARAVVASSCNRQGIIRRRISR